MCTQAPLKRLQHGGGGGVCGGLGVAGPSKNGAQQSQYRPHRKGEALRHEGESGGFGVQGLRRVPRGVSVGRGSTRSGYCKKPGDSKRARKTPRKKGARHSKDLAGAVCGINNLTSIKRRLKEEVASNHGGVPVLRAVD